MAALVQFGADIFHHVGLCRVRLADLDFVEEFLAHRGVGQRIDIEHRQFGAQDGINLVPGLGRVALHRCADGCRTLPAASARNHLALVAEQIFGDVPATIDLAHIGRAIITIGFGHLHIVEEGFAKWRIAADQQDRLGRHAFARHVVEHEGDALILVGLVGADEAENPVGVIGVGCPDLLAVNDPVVALIVAVGLQGHQIAARTGFRIALTPADFTARDFVQEPQLLPFGAELQQRRAEHPDAEAAERRARIDAAHFLAQHLGFGRA